MKRGHESEEANWQVDPRGEFRGCESTRKKMATVVVSRRTVREHTPLLPLHAAARAGYEERVRYLLEHDKVDVNAIDAFDSSAI